MSDDSDEAPAKGPGKKGKTGATKRDPNRPFPKRKKKGGLVKLAVSAALVLSVSYVSLYSLRIERLPWSWTSDDWSGFLQFSREQVEEAGRAVQQIDWEQVKAKVTEQTRKLYEGTADLERTLSERLDRLKGSGAAPAPSPASGAASPSASAAPTRPAGPAGNVEYVKGCEVFREAIKRYKLSVPAPGRSEKQQQRALKESKQLFREAQEHLAAAHADAEQGGREAEAAEIEEVLMQCNTYLEDCSKREML